MLCDLGGTSNENNKALEPASCFLHKLTCLNLLLLSWLSSLICLVNSQNPIPWWKVHNFTCQSYSFDQRVKGHEICSYPLPNPHLYSIVCMCYIWSPQKMCQPLYLRITFISKVTFSKLSNSSCRGFKLQKGANPRTIILLFFVVGHEREHAYTFPKSLNQN